jgi:hypothetical protein
MSNYAATSSLWRLRQERMLLGSAMRSSAIEQLRAYFPQPERPQRTPYEEMILDLDYQHDRVRNAYAVLRGEEEIG